MINYQLTATRRGLVEISINGDMTQTTCHQGPCWRHHAPIDSCAWARYAKCVRRPVRCEKRRDAALPRFSGTPINPRASRYKMPMTPMVTGNKERRTKVNYYILKGERKYHYDAISIVNLLLKWGKIKDATLLEEIVIFLFDFSFRYISLYLLDRCLKNINCHN